MKITIISIALALIVTGCSSSKKTGKTDVKTNASNECFGDVVSYSNQLKPVVDKQCASSGCHDSNFQGKDFTTFMDLKKEADEGEIQKHVLKIKNMPPNNSLSAQELQLFKCWLDGGAIE